MKSLLAGWTQYKAIPVVLVIAAGFIFLIRPIGLLRFHHNPMDWIDENSVSAQTYQQFTADFGPDNVLSAVFEAPEILADPVRLQTLKSISDNWKRDERVLAVLSPVDILLDGNDLGNNTQKINREWQEMSGKKIFRNLMLSPDGKHFGIFISLSPDNNAELNQSFFDRVQTDLESAQIGVHFSGPVYFAHMLERMFQADLTRVVALLALMILAMTYWYVRDIRWLFAVAVSLSASTASGLSLFYFFNEPLSLMSLIMLPLLFCVGMTGAMHLYYAVSQISADCDDRYSKGYQSVLTPGFLSMLTTAIGSAGFAFTHQSAIQPLGKITPCAIGLTFAGVFLMLPSFYRMIGGRYPHRPAPEKSGYAWSRKSALPVALVLVWFAAGCYFVSGLKTDQDAMSFFSEQSELKQSYRYTEENLTGTSVYEILLEAENIPEAQDPSAIRNLDAFVSRLDTQPGFIGSMSAVNLIDEAFSRMRIRKGIQEANDGDIQRALKGLHSKAPELTGKYLPENLPVQRISAHFSHDSGVLGDPAQLITEAWNKSGLHDRFHLKITGFIPLILENQREILHSQIYAYSFICMLMGLMFVAVFRSLRISLYAAAVNLIPIVCAAGIMPLMDYRLNMINVFVMSIMLGIVVDDSIHLLYAYQRKGSLESALCHTGQAIKTTSIIVGTGFFSLIVSEIVPIRQFAVLAGVTVFAAYLCDRYLLYFLTAVFKK